MYHLLVSIKVCPKIEMTYDVGAPSQINLTLPGTDRVDAQRRKSVDNAHPDHCCKNVWFVCRQRALKALDERLGKTAAQPQTWPSMDETGSSQDEQDTSPPPPSSSSYPPPPPPPESVVVEKIPGAGGVEGEGIPLPKSTGQPPTKTHSTT